MIKNLLKQYNIKGQNEIYFSKQWSVGQLHLPLIVIVSSHFELL